MSQPDLATLCDAHLGDEETLLAAVLTMVRAVKEAFLCPSVDALRAQVENQQEVATRIGTMRQRREAVRGELARRLQVTANEATLSRVLAHLPAPSRQSLLARADRVRQMTDELVALNYWLAVHLRIHLDAYQRLLSELTGATNSGRYGPAGKTVGVVYPPMIQLQG